MPVLLVGGTEIQTLNLVRVLISAGYKVTVCCYYEYDEDMVRRFELAGVQVLLMKYERAKGLIRLAIGLVQLFKTANPEIVHVQYLAPGLIPIIAARLAGIRTVFATVHIAGSIAYGRKAKMLLRTAALLCDCFFCVARGTEEFWFGDSAFVNNDNVRSRRRHFTIYNEVDSDGIAMIVEGSERAALRRSLGIDDQPVVGIAGRLTRQKGQAVLLEALSEVIKEYPRVVLLVVGGGPDRERLESKANELGLGGVVRWVGAVPQEKVFELYGIMDIFVMPSLYEGFGLTAAEAMAAGLPVLGTKVEGLSEIIIDGVTGRLLTPGDSHELAVSLVEFIGSPEKRKTMGEKGRERVRELFSGDRFRADILTAYGELAS